MIYGVPFTWGVAGGVDRTTAPSVEVIIIRNAVRFIKLRHLRLHLMKGLHRVMTMMAWLPFQKMFTFRTVSLCSSSPFGALWKQRYPAKTSSAPSPLKIILHPVALTRRARRNIGVDARTVVRSKVWKFQDQDHSSMASHIVKPCVFFYNVIAFKWALFDNLFYSLSSITHEYTVDNNTI